MKEFPPPELISFSTVGFEPQDEMHTVHHMSLSGCPVPAKKALAEKGKYWYVVIITSVTELVLTIYIHLMTINEILIVYFKNIIFKKNFFY